MSLGQFVEFREFVERISAGDLPLNTPQHSVEAEKRRVVVSAVRIVSGMTAEYHDNVIMNGIMLLFYDLIRQDSSDAPGENRPPEIKERTYSVYAFKIRIV